MILSDNKIHQRLSFLVRGCHRYGKKKAAHSGFETQRCHQKSKMGVSVAPQKDMCPPKIFLKKNYKKDVPGV